MMRIRLEHSELVGDLREFLGRCECVVEQRGSHMLTVELKGSVAPGALRDDWARMQLGAYLRVWQARHPGTVAQLLVEGDAKRGRLSTNQRRPQPRLSPSATSAGIPRKGYTR
ncbi:MAG: hypothetical protein ACRDN6_06210 [Gaiellaceae bacterium]